MNKVVIYHGSLIHQRNEGFYTILFKDNLKEAMLQHTEFYKKQIKDVLNTTKSKNEVRYAKEEELSRKAANRVLLIEAKYVNNKKRIFEEKERCNFNLDGRNLFDQTLIKTRGQLAAEKERALHEEMKSLIRKSNQKEILTDKIYEKVINDINQS